MGSILVDDIKAALAKKGLQLLPPPAAVSDREPYSIVEPIVYTSGHIVSVTFPQQSSTRHA